MSPYLHIICRNLSHQMAFRKRLGRRKFHDTQTVVSGAIEDREIAVGQWETQG